MNLPLLGLDLVLIAFIFCAFYAAAAQDAKERVIRRLPIDQNEPIAITDIKVNGKSVSLDKKFNADDEWLRGLAVSIENKSEKRILLASIQLQFHHPPGSKDPMSVDDIFYGNWALQTRPPTSEEQLVGIAPSETVEIRLSSQQYVDLRNFLTGTGFAQSIERVDMRIDRVIFEDDAMLSGGSYLRRAQNDPGSWKVSP